MSEGADVVIVMKPGMTSLPAALEDALASFRAHIMPQSSAMPAAAVSPFWHVNVPAEQAAELISSLLELPEVDGAYVKPPDSVP